MGNAAPILARNAHNEDDLSDMTSNSSTSTSSTKGIGSGVDHVSATHKFWFQFASTASRVGNLVVLQKSLVNLRPSAEDLETLSTTAAVHGNAHCLRALVEFAASEDTVLHLRAADAAASFHGRTECSMYLRDLFWPTSAVAQHQQRLCALLNVDFCDLESGEYHLARSIAFA